jgi:cyclic pyranopterin monophosphate synthase
MGLSHVDESGLPRMVDVGHKAVTQRMATAQASVWLPPAVFDQLAAQQFNSAKGSVITTAIVAGTSAVKRTSDLIPFCHPLMIESCDFVITPNRPYLVIQCRVGIAHKTGVEMEALTGASVAALTIYDMCKALSADIRIEAVHLLEKRGGKHDVG